MTRLHPLSDRRRPGSWPALLAAILLAGAATAAHAAPAALDAATEVREMGRGLNVLGYDPLWNDPSKARFTVPMFAKIKAAGFDTIRVDLNAFPHMDAKDQLSADWWRTMDWIVDSATRQGLHVIVDEHNYNECGKALEDCRPKLEAFWRQVGDHYRDAPASVMFELLNEPNTQLDDDSWNALSAQLLAIVRQSNPTRNVVIGPASWNSVDHLDALKLPEGDRHIIATVHYYVPMEFTHQGASWNPATYHMSGVTWGSPDQRAKLEHNLDHVQAWSQAHHRPILLGEFGAYDKGPMESRIAYTSAVARGAEARGWAWTYWQFDGDFIAYDMAKDDWVHPILDALVPPQAR